MIKSEKKKPRILIVDDTPQNIQILGTILLKEGYQLNVSRNGLQALEILKKILPDIILLDVMMPEMDGFETCRHIKNSEKTKDIPVIFLTARTDKTDIISGFDIGAVDYITKPFNAKELLVRIRTHLELKFSKDMIKKASHERKELLHVLCHDLINPFNSIISVLNFIDDNSQFEAYKNLLLSSAQNGRDIIKLVKEMRALEEYKIRLENVKLLYAVQHSYSMLKHMFEKKNIDIKINIKDHLNIYVEMASFINSVLNNLLTNAIKFSYPGSQIIINAQEKNEFTEIYIQDFGIGMHPKLLNDIFDITKATSRLGTDGERGTGFGMPLIKKFINAYGGEIKIESKEERKDSQDHGTKVWLKLKSDN